MKKILLLSVVALLMLIPSTAFAVGSPTLTIAPNGLSFTITVPWGVSDFSFPDVTFCDGTMSRSIFDPHILSKTFYFDKPISHVEVYLAFPYYQDLVASRNCESIEAEPHFLMWLLTRDDEGCILLSETHPSVERQKALCFPATDPDWVADNAPCADYVYDNDYWSCDAFGFSRLPLYDENGPDLWEVWQRHAARE